MKKPVNFSKDKLSVQWKYVNRNLKVGTNVDRHIGIDKFYLP